MSHRRGSSRGRGILPASLSHEFVGNITLEERFLRLQKENSALKGSNEGWKSRYEEAEAKCESMQGKIDQLENLLHEHEIKQRQTVYLLEEAIKLQNSEQSPLSAMNGAGAGIRNRAGASRGRHIPNDTPRQSSSRSGYPGNSGSTRRQDPVPSTSTAEPAVAVDGGNLTRLRASTRTTRSKLVKEGIIPRLNAASVDSLSPQYAKLHKKRDHNGHNPWPCSGCYGFFPSQQEMKEHQRETRCAPRRIMTGQGYESIRVEDATNGWNFNEA